MEHVLIIYTVGIIDAVSYTILPHIVAPQLIGTIAVVAIQYTKDTIVALIFAILMTFV